MEEKKLLHVLRIIIFLLLPFQAKAAIYVFVSNSMGKTLLSDYVIEAEKHDATLVFRGLVKGSFKEIGNLASEILQDKNVGMIIDDNLYNKYSIQSVPTIILLDEETGAFHKITGNVGLTNALGIFKELGDPK